MIINAKLKLMKGGKQTNGTKNTKTGSNCL